ncbi:MAG TPA: zf-TFIIB domain-containing protein [Anaeromyxobacter sp.]
MSDKGTPGKASQSEEEYFVREDAEKKRRLALQAAKDAVAAEKKRLRDLHWMRCPKCGMELHEVDFGGMDVDVCFTCNGVFLDQGELQSILKTEKHTVGVMGSILNLFKRETKTP